MTGRTAGGARKLSALAAGLLTLAGCSSGGGVDPADADEGGGNTPSPVVNIAADPLTVAPGGTASLSWDATNADSCLASGAWSGTRPTAGAENVGPLDTDSVYTLSCDGPGGQASASVTITVSPGGSGGIRGNVDSSLVDRRGDNRVYVYAGSATPDDYDGDSGDPVMSIPVIQDDGACTFSYDQAPLAPGDYTLAFTSDAAADDPAGQDTLEFVGTTAVSIADEPETIDFDAPSGIRVGPGRQYATVAEAAAAARDGDVVEIDAGLYSADVAAWNQDRLTLRGVGGYAHLRADGANSQGKAIWVLAGADTVVENIEFSEISVPDRNGAGIRLEGRNLTVCNAYFHDSDEGILGGAGEVLIEYSEFDNNGFGDGFSHNIYILDADRFTLRHSYVHHAHVGHNVKTRARENHILYNRIMDEGSGDSSYALDIPNGGLSFVIGNLMQQGVNAQNSSMVNYGTEGLSDGRTHNLYLVNNTMVDDYGGNFVQAAAGTGVVRMINNLLVGSGEEVAGVQGSLTTNLKTTSPQLVDIDGYDYRLTNASAARDAGSVPGSGDGVSLLPVYEYRHPTGREPRPSVGNPDIGAYEYSP